MRQSEKSNDVDLLTVRRTIDILTVRRLPAISKIRLGKPLDGKTVLVRVMLFLPSSHSAVSKELDKKSGWWNTGLGKLDGL